MIRFRLPAVLSVSCVLSLTLAHPGGAQRPPGQRVAESLADNVVRVVVGNQEGFGFIVGERNSRLIIVTASHIIGHSTVAPAVVFRTDPGREHPAQLLDLRQDRLDLAVVEASVPPGFNWRLDSRGASSVTERGTQVWYVGKNRLWHVPTIPGSVSDIDNVELRISVEGLDVQVGTSGAPLISETGIIGMIVDDATEQVRATPIHLIEEQVGRWQLPWQLGRLRGEASGVRTVLQPGGREDSPGEPAVVLFRSHGKQLSEDELRAMIHSRGFYVDNINKDQFESGADWLKYRAVEHRYGRQVIGRDTVVVDSATGLMWQKSGSCNSTQECRDRRAWWADVAPYLDELNTRRFAGYSDWRLPTVEEAAALLEYRDPEPGVFYQYIPWTVFSRHVNGIWTSDWEDEEHRWVIHLAWARIERVDLEPVTRFRTGEVTRSPVWVKAVRSIQ